MFDNINYSLCWEDNSILKILLRDRHKVLMVGSGGCLTFSSLSYNNVEIDVVEINELQNKLIRLKSCAFQNLSFENCMSFLGTFSPPNFDQNKLKLFQKIASYLSDEDRSYWNSKLDIIANGLIHCGKWEKYLHLWNSYFLPLAVGKKTINAFISSENIDQQQKLYEKKINVLLDRFLIRILASKTMQSRFGRHPDLLKHFKGSPGKVFYERLKRAWCEIPIAKNYYFRYMLESYYRKSMSLPEWAIKENFISIRKRIKNISYYSNDLTQFLSDTSKTYDMIYISNITDTMTIDESTLLFKQCALHLNLNGKLIIWNNLIKRKPLTDFELIEDISALIEKNRLATYYGFFGAYKLK